jgi:membrane-associated phospholipid phosphatase
MMRPPLWRNLAAVRLVLIAAFAVLGALVVAGACTRIDQYAVDHWMAHVGTGSTPTSLLRSLRPYPDLGSSSQVVFNVWTFPGSVFVSAAVLALCCTLLVRRGDDRAAAAWIVAWVVANAVEVAGKGLLHRPTLTTMVHGVRNNLTGLDSSFPSGHTARGLLVAFMIAALWPRLSWPVALWAIGTCVLLVVSGAHAPSDVLGGALVALFVTTWVPWRPRFLRQE